MPGTIADREIIVLLEQIMGNSGSAGSLTLPYTLTGKFRIKGDGSFQLYNSDTTKYHTLSLSGAEGAVTIDIGAGES